MAHRLSGINQGLVFNLKRLNENGIIKHLAKSEFRTTCHLCLRVRAFNNKPQPLFRELPIFLKHPN
jgi:hypothetical protein